MPKRSRQAPKYLDDYILEKVTRRNSSCNLDNVKQHRRNVDDLISDLDNLDLGRHNTSEDDLIDQLKNMEIGAMDSKVDELISKKARIGGQKGGAIMGMNATGLIMYLIADAIKEGANYGYAQITKLLDGGLKVLEFFSNKNSCAELVLREYLGNQLMLFIQFFYIGVMTNEVANPMNVINKLVELLPKSLDKLIPYVTQGISASSIAAIGYLVYHFVNHYGTNLSENAKGKVESLKTALDALENAPSDVVVETVISKLTDIKDAATNLVTQLTEEPPVLTDEEKTNFMKHIKEELTRIPAVRQGGVPMTMVELRGYIPEGAAEGGKKHKKRKTQKRKNKSNKKTTKKSNKSKKHRK